MGEPGVGIDSGKQVETAEVAAEQALWRLVSQPALGDSLVHLAEVCGVGEVVLGIASDANWYKTMQR